MKAQTTYRVRRTAIGTTRENVEVRSFTIPTEEAAMRLAVASFFGTGGHEDGWQERATLEIVGRTVRAIFEESDAGCYVDGARGHYSIPAMIEFGIGQGFIIDPCEAFVLARYDSCLHDDDYPVSVLDEITGEIENWLNGDTGGANRPAQPTPPVIPDGYAWGWNDGDFGLYAIEDDE